MLRPHIAKTSSALAFLVAAPIACGATRSVQPGQSIQAAINASFNGDVIVVAPGTYFEAIDFLGKRIHLRSSFGPAVTTIDASQAGWRSTVMCENYEDRQTVLEGFTITGGRGDEPFAYMPMGGGMLIIGSSPTVVNCVFRGNQADWGGGICSFGSALVVNCLFSDNIAGEQGGAIYSYGDDAMINCTFYGNSAQIGGAIVTSDDYGGGPLTSQLHNSIVWGNSPAHDQIADIWTAMTLVSHCVVEGGYAGDAVIDADPMFVNAAAGDFRLAAGSPAADAGHNWLMPRDTADLDRDGNRKELLARDLGGSARVMDDLGAPAWCGTVVDMGAFERSGTALAPALLGDLDGDRRVTYTDLLILVEDMGPADDLCNPADLNVDGMVDALDLDILKREMPSSSGGTGQRRIEY